MRDNKFWEYGSVQKYEDEAKITKIEVKTRE